MSDCGVMLRQRQCEKERAAMMGDISVRVCRKRESSTWQMVLKNMTRQIGGAEYGLSSVCGRKHSVR